MKSDNLAIHNNGDITFSSAHSLQLVKLTESDSTTTLPSNTKYLFVTSQSYNGNLNGYAEADAICNSDANNSNRFVIHRVFAGTNSN